MAKRWTVTCRWPDGDINHRTHHQSREAAQRQADLVNAAQHCVLEHIIEEVETADA